MIHRDRQPQQMVESFVEAALRSEPYVQSCFYALEKLPRSELPADERLFAPLFNECGDLDFAPEHRLKVGEWGVTAAHYFGLCWPAEMLSEVVAPRLLELFNEADSMPPILTSAFATQRDRAILALSHLAPAFEKEQANTIFTQLFDHVSSQEKISVRSLLALAQFEGAIVQNSGPLAGSSQTENDPTELIIAATVQSIEDLNTSLSEATSSRRVFLGQAMPVARQACVALVMLSSIAENIVLVPGVEASIEKVVSGAQWLAKILDSQKLRERMEFNSAQQSLSLMSSLRAALACMVDAHPVFENLVRESPIALNMVDDPFGSLVLKRSLVGLTNQEELKLSAIVEYTIDSLAPDSRCGPGTDHGQRVAAALWRLELAESSEVRRALQGRCDPSVQSFLYRAAQG